MDNTKEVLTEESTETTTEKFDPRNYKVVMNMIKEVDDSYNTLKESILGRLREANLSDSIMEAMLPYEKEDIPNMDIETIKQVLNNNATGPLNFGTDSDDELRNAFLTLKNESLLLLSTKMDTEKIKAESSDVLKDYFNYISSDRVRKSREERLAALKEAVATETNEVTKNKMEKMIKTMERSLNFSFILERFNQFGDREVKSIVEGFFSENKGNYIAERFIRRVEKFGYTRDVYKSFYNIEENFLPKKYSPFNNIFLYWYMRFVGYSDPYSKTDIMLVQSLTSAMADLVYHKFGSSEAEQYFISIIEELVDKFADYEDKFKESNTTYEGHPERIAAEKAHEENRRAALIKSLRRLNIEGFDEDMDIEEMQKLYSDTVEALIEKQVSEAKEKESENTDGTTEEETTEEVVEDSEE